MDAISKKIYDKVLKLEVLYIDLFGIDGMNEFLNLAIKNVEDEFSKKPFAMNLYEKLIIEEIILYLIAMDGKEGVNAIKQFPEYENLSKKGDINIKDYDELEKYYKKFLDKIREFIKKNDGKDVIFKP